MTRLYLHPLTSSVGVGRFDLLPYSKDNISTDFIIMSFLAVRWSILVVEPSPEFHDRHLAACCLLFSLFEPSRLLFPTTLCCGNLYQGFPIIYPILIYPPF